MAVRPEMRRMIKGPRGYNLVEVLIAMAILGSVLLSIVSLFYLGRRNVYSGKQLTYVNSVGVQVLEDLSNLDMTALYAAFGITSSSSLGSSASINGVVYPNCITRNLASTDVTPPGFLTRWKTTLGTGNRLQDPTLTLILTPTLPSSLWTATTPAKPAPSIMRIRIVIGWKEGSRQRYVTLDTVKTQRS